MLALLCLRHSQEVVSFDSQAGILYDRRLAADVCVTDALRMTGQQFGVHEIAQPSVAWLPCILRHQCSLVWPLLTSCFGSGEIALFT
jgi:hypothetical protein